MGGEVVGETFDAVVGESGLAAALSMPDDAGFYTFVYLGADVHDSEHLLVAHDVLFKASNLYTTFCLDFSINVCYAVVKQEQDALLAEHRGDDAIGRRIDLAVGRVFLQGFYFYAVAVEEDLFLCFS